MKLTFIHTGEKIKKDIEGNFYTDGSYSMKIWNRYLERFNDITLVMRQEKSLYTKEEALKKFNLVDSEKIRFVPVPNVTESMKTYFNFSQRRQKKITIRNAIDWSDIVIVRLPGVNWVIDYSKKQNKICMVEVVGCPFDTLWNHSLKGKMLAIPSAIKLKLAMRKASYSIYVTEKFLQKRYPTKGKSISVSDVNLEPIPIEKLEKKWASMRDTGELIIGTAGALNVPYKGQQYVIEAIAALKKTSNNRLIYVMAGTGDNTRLKNLAKSLNVEDSIIFAGSIPCEKMSEWYDSLDLYIQPSTVEGLPRAVLEAMGRGLPVIGSRVGGIPEVVDEIGLFQKADIKMLATTINKFDAMTRKQQSEINYKKSLEFTNEKLDQKRKDFYFALK